MTIDFIPFLLIIVASALIVYALITFLIFVVKESVEIAILNTINKKYLIDEYEVLETHKTLK